VSEANSAPSVTDAPRNASQRISNRIERLFNRNIHLSPASVHRYALARRLGPFRRVPKDFLELAMFVAVGLSVVSVVLLYFHFRWAMIDPHNPAERPGFVSLIFKSLLLTLGLAITPILKQSWGEDVGSMVGAVLLGFVVGPAIVPPFNLRVDEEPSWFMRQAEALREMASGLVLKIPLVGAGGWLLGWLGVPRSWYVMLGFIALGSNFAKIPVVQAMFGEEKVTASLRKAKSSLKARQIMPFGLFGNLSLFVWLILFYPFADLIANASVPNLINASALILAIALSIFF
jgi:hypothetical protein